MIKPIDLFVKRNFFALSMSKIRHNFSRYKSEIATNSKEIDQTSDNLPLAGYRVVDLTRILGEYYNTSNGNFTNLIVNFIICSHQLDLIVRCCWVILGKIAIFFHNF